MRIDIRGMTLVEVLIAAAVSAVIVSASMSILSPVTQLKMQLDSDTGLNLVLTQMRDCIMNDTAWTNTVNSNPTSMACLNQSGTITPSPCQPSQLTPIELMSQFRPAGSGNPVDCVGGQDLSNPQARYNTLNASDGFTMGGAVCHTFNGAQGQGNVNCPFHLDMLWEALCPQAPAPCTNPLVHVVGTMHYNSALSTTHYVPNLQKLSVDLVRGRADQLRHLSLYEVVTPTSPPGTPLNPPMGPPNIGASHSQCNGYRQFGTLMMIDTGNMVNFNGSSPPGTFELSPGSYNCTISAPARGVGHHRIFLVDLDNRTIILSGTSEYSFNTQTRSIATGFFTLQVQAHLGVIHWCQAAGTPPMIGGQYPWFAMGVPSFMQIPSSPTAYEVYAVMNCTVLTK